MKRILLAALASLLLALIPIFAHANHKTSAVIHEPQLRSEVFDLLDLDAPGLEKVRKFHKKGRDQRAAKELLKYYRTRTGVGSLDFPTEESLKKAHPSEKEQLWADEALEHKFFSHYGYQPSFFYGDDINWRYWPVEDNELRWQLHRHKWFTPLGKAYRATGDEKYVLAWRDQYLDWIIKNPQYVKTAYDFDNPDQSSEDKINFRFSWRPLEVSHRVQDQIPQFQLMLPSENFTPEFLTEFLLNYYNHVDYLTKHYSAQGNHLLFEAQRTFAAGVFFREFKDAEKWRKQGVEVLNREISKQVLSDGGHYELDPHYHLACIEIFAKSLRIAALGGYESAFPRDFWNYVENLINFYANICFPDYTNPCFSDAKITDKTAMLKHYALWTKLFPQNELIRYMATEGKEGSLPSDSLSVAYPVSGFYVIRNGWGMQSTQFDLKAGPPGHWHCQPDNGTFELWYNGRNLFPDSGSYVYAGNAEVNRLRNWFRESQHHNTVTLDSANFETCNSHLVKWEQTRGATVLVVENPSYEGFVHERTVVYSETANAVTITDRISGAAKGTVNLNYQLPDGPCELRAESLSAQTAFPEGANFTLSVKGPKGTVMNVHEGWVSRAYRERNSRHHISFDVYKAENETIEFTTQILLYSK